MYVNFRCESADISKQDDTEWKIKRPNIRKQSPRLMPQTIDVVSNFKEMIPRDFRCDKPPIYNKRKTEMQKKYTIDVKTRTLLLRNDYSEDDENV